MARNQSTASSNGKHLEFMRKNRAALAPAVSYQARRRSFNEQPNRIGLMMAKATLWSALAV